MALTKNSYSQLLRCQSSLQEINSVDQNLGFVYLLANFVQKCHSCSHKSAQSCTAAVQAKYKLLSHFELTDEVNQTANEQLVLPFLKLLVAELQHVSDTFNQVSFV